MYIWPYLRPIKVLNSSKILLLGHKQTPGIPQVHPMFEGQAYGTAAVYQSTPHCEESGQQWPVP